MITDEQVKAEIAALNEELLSKYAASQADRKILETLKNVKFDPPSDAAHQVVVYRYPIEDLPVVSSVTCALNQLAVLVEDGEPMILRPGEKHTLTELINSNVKLINKWEKKATGGDPISHVVIYFINLHKHPDLPFSTADGPVQIFDATMNRPVLVKAYGNFGAHIDDADFTAENALIFINEYVCTRGVVTASDFKTILKGRIQKYLKSSLAKAIANQGISSLNLAAYQDDLSASLFETLKEEFKKESISLDHFSIEGMKSEDDPTYKEYAEAARKDIASAAEARKRQREGYTYQDEKGFDVMKTAAGNNATMGTFMGAGMGLGMGLGMGAGMGGAMGNMANNTMGQVNNPGNAPQPQPQPSAPMNTAGGANCPQCGGVVPPGSKFCPSCGAPVQAGPKFCPNCGSPIDPNAKFCPNCGNKIG